MKFERYIEDAKSVLVISSKPLDFDSIASGLILKKYLESIGKEVRAVFPRPFTEEEKLRNAFLPYFDELEAIDTWGLLTKKSFDIVVFVDGANIVQFYDETIYSNQIPDYRVYSKRINIDHHQNTPEELGTVAYKDVNASCTVEIILTKIIPQEFITKNIATLAIAAIIGDTGNYQWKYRPATHRLSAMLLEKGADADVVVEKIVASKSKSQFEALVWIINNVEYDDKLGSTFLCLPNETIVKYKWSDLYLQTIKYAYLEDFARRIPEYPRGFLLVETKPQEIRIGVRGSNLNNNINMPDMFRELGGNAGGHFNASGVTMSGEFKEVKERLKQIIKKWM
jgi:nanoRNase/pAp phosphatase (c-di-AMP/oligoRNAs hydrolase)